MSFEMRMKFPNVSGFSCAIVHDEFERLRQEGWSIAEDSSISFLGRMISGKGRIFPTVFREIHQLYLAEVHWGQRFLGLEPTEISVVFQNSLFPLCEGNDRFFDTGNRWVRSESEIFPGCCYRTRTNVTEKTLEVQVSGGQQLGRENWKKFLIWLGLYLAATKITRELHQFRMAAEKVAAGENCMPEMDRHHAKILEIIGAYLPR